VIQYRWKSWLLVGLQFGLVGILLIFSQPLIINESLVCYALGGGLGGWAVLTMGIGNFNVIPDVKTSARFVQRLPYRVIRHPMYLSLLFICLGLMLQPLRWEKAVIWSMLCVVLDVKTRYEEQLLRQKFPEYAHYQTQTHRFIPYIY
jgi:protein-S-isoprenylcysteine O-methyltransferase Ste14